MECEYSKDKLSEAIVLARTRASDFESVKKLNFWGSGIRDVSVVKKLPNLEVCSLSVNKISTLKDFSQCENLKELFIRKNQIEDLSEICHLKSLPNLRNLWLADNPCEQTDNYRQTVLKTLPNLQKLDNVAVSVDELSQAEEEGIDLSETFSPEVNNEDPQEDLDVDDTKDTEKDDEVNAETCPDNSNNKDDAEQVKDATETCKDSENDTKQNKNDISNKTAFTNGAMGKRKDDKKLGQKSSKSDPLESSMLDPVTLSWEETNKIREELGLKPLPLEKITSPKPVPSSKERSKNAHVLQAVLILLRELDKDSLEIIQNTIQRKLSSDS